MAREPGQIRLGQLVRDAEPNLGLVECFNRETNTCPIIGVCELKPVLREALEAFLATLNRYTLEDLLARGAGEKLRTVFATIAAARA